MHSGGDLQHLGILNYEATTQTLTTMMETRKIKTNSENHYLYLRATEKKNIITFHVIKPNQIPQNCYTR